LFAALLTFSKKKYFFIKNRPNIIYVHYDLFCLEIVDDDIKMDEQSDDESAENEDKEELESNRKVIACFVH